MQTARERVPVRTIAVAIGMVLATALVLYLVLHLSRVLIWIVIAAFLSVLLSPVVTMLEHRLRLHRALATLVVFLVGLIVVAGIVTMFARPVVREVSQFADDVPRYVEEARSGRGPVGELVQRFNLDRYLEQNQDRLRESLSGLGEPALKIAHTIATTVVGIIAVLVLTFLMVLEGPRLVDRGLALLPEHRQTRIRGVTSDCGRAVTGYMTGQLLIALICAVLTYLVLLILGVPFRGTVALFVGIFDLIPLVGATLGAVVAAVVAFLHSVPAGLVVVGWFIVYQQLENHLLQPVFMSRTVKLNPLTVLIAIMLGVELAGILGALLAIPVAGMIQVIIRDLWDHRRGRPKPEPTVGEEEIPAVQTDDSRRPAAVTADAAVASTAGSTSGSVRTAVPAAAPRGPAGDAGG